MPEIDNFALAQELWKDNREADAGIHLRRLQPWELVLFTAWACKEFGNGEGVRIVDALAEQEQA